jgi:NAD(P)-dependent dehydrogenase (short-subunit alcohol dehydrogenase family)
MEFAGQRAVVTGASSGIGREIAVGLARCGARLWVLGRDRKRLETALCAAASQAASISVHETDLSRPEDVAAVVDDLRRELDGVDILVHSAGMIFLGPIESAPVEQFDLQYQVNMRAPYLLTQGLLPLLRDAHGQVVFVNSTAGLKANANAGQYSATKHGLKALADGLRDEENRHGVRVLSVFTGRTATPMQQGIIGREGKSWMPDYLIQPEDLAATVLHALSLPRTVELTDIALRPFRKYPE